jgi:DNA (cytosine-5)-methyltransferase 1
MLDTLQPNLLYGRFDDVLKAALNVQPCETSAIGSFWPTDRKLKFVDLFCGIGGFHSAAASLGMECVFACDIDADCRIAYAHNYGIEPKSDICAIEASDIPDMDILLAGFPCQPFSIIGSRNGFADARGTLFFEIARIIEAKKPKAFVLENVKQLATHNKGETLKHIIDILKELHYDVEFRILNALNFGLPQRRERVMIVGFRNDGEYKAEGFHYPSTKIPMAPLSTILEKNPDPRHIVSERIRNARVGAHTATVTPSIWHENKAGNISSHPYSCALRAGASYNYLLVNGERRLTPREMLRLQGFPETFDIICTDGQTRKQAGNAVPVPMVKAVLERVLNVQQRSKTQG